MMLLIMTIIIIMIIITITHIIIIIIMEAVKLSEGSAGGYGVVKCICMIYV